ncbi:hypothetical protein DTO045G8_2811 [Paecilomyces variotii]|nr:hypothetical protein DTO045G8_2811 [Paecilomyces variotii]
MWIPHLDYQHLQPRQSQNSDKNTSLIVGVTVIVFVISSCVVTYTVLRALRKRDYEPKLLPGKYLKQKWKNWNPGKTYGQVSGGSTPDRNQDTSYNPVTTVNSEMRSTNAPRRDSSIRSVITLPAYSVTPKPTEQVIAREGERAGMDVVVEFPETAEEEESRRESQMEALYQIRLRRRRELEAREERRRERREARSRGDLARLEELRRESIRRRSEDASSPTPSAAAMLAEQRSRSRQRRISSVSYAALGQVRHDGSRLRANSADSDQAPLLDSAGAMGTEARPSLSSSRTNSHFRGDSGSSMMSGSTGGSDSDTLNPVVSRISAGPGASEQDEVDVGESEIPPPPDYEEVGLGDAPPYESPTSERRPGIPQLAGIANIPAIHIDVATPLTATPNTPRFPPVRESEDSTQSDHESIHDHQ